MRLNRVLLGGAVVSMLIWIGVGCSSTRRITVPVEPRVDLGAYRTIGLVTFASNEADEELRRLCTLEFIQAMQSAQPGTRVLELGSESAVLSSVNRRQWDATTFRAVSEAHGVDALVLGRFDVDQSRPSFQISTRSLGMRSDVNASLSARLMETDSGATMWTDSARMTAEVASGQINDQGEGGFGATDPQAVYADMISGMVEEITDDFRVHYITKRVPKDQLQTASADVE